VICCHDQLSKKDNGVFGMNNKLSTKYPIIFGFLLCILSTILCVLAFPKCDFWPLMWVGLVPMFFVLDNKKPLSAFIIACFCGLLFFASTIYWLNYVTALGAILLYSYLALYFGCFGLFYSLFRDRPVDSCTATVPAEPN